MSGVDPMLVEARSVTKRYGTGPGAVTALHEASFSIDRGEFVAVMGPSGSGKSSLMNLIGLLDRPTGGALHVMGREIATLSPDAQARLRGHHIGFVFQSYNLMPRRTALGNVELPLAYRGVQRRERRRRSEAALDKVGLSDHAAAYPGEMSGGEQQRVSIARALVSDPDLIVADEPTGALDSASGDQVVSLLQSVCADGRTVMMVTHDPEAAKHASRFMFIRDGLISRDDQGAAGIPSAPMPLSS
jgi:ABC-type lipoprotein export system ATPase subunit